MSNLNMITPLTVQGIINKFCYTIGMLPTSYKQSLTYEEQLLAIGHYLETTVYPAINNNAQALAELQTLFAALQDYVNNYFDNLDVTEEINAKLDDMAESGELQEIIEQFLLLNSAIICNTVSDMAVATNLLSGSIVKTLGFYNVGDGGHGYYRITDDDLTANGMDILQIANNLFAVLIPQSNLINIRQYGAKSDDSTFDNADIIKYIINKLDSFGGGTLFLPTGRFYTTEITFDSGRLRNITIQGNGHYEASKGTELYFNDVTTLFTFNELWNFEIKDLQLSTSSQLATAMKVTHGFYRSKISNCSFKYFKYGIEAQTYAYIYIEKTNFTANTDNGHHIQLGKNYTGLCEFAFITECMFNGSDENNNFDGIIINSGATFKINKCDFANLGESHAILIETTENNNIVDCDITNCNIIRCDKGIELYAHTGSISTITIDKLMYYFRGDNNDDIAIYTHRESDFISELFVTNLSLRQLSTYTGNVFSINNSRGEIEILSNNTNSMPVVNNKLITYRYIPFKINGEYTITLSGSATYGYIDLSNNSPFSEKPPLIILQRTSTDSVPVLNILNTFKGQLRVMVSWTTAPGAGTYTFQIFTPMT